MTVKNEIHRLVAELIEHNYNYYVLDKPTISDAEWDLKFNHLKALEATNPQFIQKDSPTQNVGHPVVASHFALVAHRFPMLSLDNSLTTDALIDWTIDLFDSKHLDKRECRIEWKMDGLSLDLIYHKGRLLYAVTRGDGSIGENVTLNALQIPSIPKVLSGAYDQEWVSVRGEVVANLKHYRKLNDDLVTKGKSPYANPRNYAAGSLRQKDPAITAGRGLEFYAYSVTSEPSVHTDWGKEQQFMLANGFLTASTGVNFVYDPIRCQHTKIPDTVNQLQSLRSQLPFEVDGLVIKVIDHTQRELLGYTAKFPKWATAYKFPASEGHTELLDIEYQIGRTGKATPVARIAPVHVHGTTITNVTLHNRTQIERLKLYKGCKVIVRRAGDVIPKIEGTVEPYVDQALYEPLTKCPCCNMDTVIVKGKDGEQDYCPNVKCKDRLVAHLNYCTQRNVLNIKGLGDELVLALYTSNVVDANRPLSLLSLTKEDFIKIGQSDHMAIKLENAVLLAKGNLDLTRVITALGIDNVAEGTAERLARALPSMDLIANATVDQLVGIDDIGDTTANRIIEYFRNDQLKSVDGSAWKPYVGGLTLRAPEPLGRLFESGTAFVVTGSKFGNWSRKEVESWLKKNGAKVTSAVTKTTKAIYCGTKYTAHKLETAKRLGVPYQVFSEDGTFVTDISIAHGVLNV